jgi:hypothetical protein
MPGPAEQPRPETAPRQPLRRLSSMDVDANAVRQMADEIGGRFETLGEDFLAVPYLVHPLGIRIRFEEPFGYDGNDKSTTISISPALRAIDDGFKTGEITVEDADVQIFEDKVVLKQHGQIMIDGEGEDIIDKVTLTREGYSYTREFTIPR